MWSHDLCVNLLFCTCARMFLKLREENPALLCITIAIVRQRQRSKKFRLAGPDYKAFHGSEIISKLTEGPKNRTEALCGATGSSLSCCICTLAILTKVIKLNHYFYSIALTL